MSLTRAEQRAIGVLLSTSEKLRNAGESTLSATIHATSDQLEWMVSFGGATFRDYDARTRRRMAKEGSALPDGSFPIANCSDAEDAIRSIGRAAPGKRASAEAHIRKRVRALRCSGSIFDRWK